MSVRAISWAFDIGGIPSPAKFVLVAIADAASEEGWCFPSIRRICSKTNLGRNTVSKYLSELEVAGYLKRTHRYRSDGSFTSNEYQLCMDGGGSRDEPPSSPHGRGVVHEMNQGSSPHGHHEPSVNRKEEEKDPPIPPKGGETEEAATTKETKAEYPQEFEDWWSRYPKRSGSNSKKAAFRCWKARQRAGIAMADLMLAVKVYAGECKANGKTGTPYVMMASTFLGPDEHWKEYLSTDTNPAKAPSRTPCYSDHLNDLFARAI